jgi:hypothetical protein
MGGSQSRVAKDLYLLGSYTGPLDQLVCDFSNIYFHLFHGQASNALLLFETPGTDTYLKTQHNTSA